MAGLGGHRGRTLALRRQGHAGTFIALWLAFRLGLDSPNTAMTTTLILALPSSGMVLEKAFYRLLGTVVGCGVALILMALFPQNVPLLFCGLALWIGLCTCGSALHRNQQSYSFVLAGYTACMITFPSFEHPLATFALAVTRTTEVGLGIIVSAVVHDAVFPRHQSNQVMRTVQARYDGFVSFCQQVLEQRLTPAETELNHLRFAADIAALESGRAAAFFEAAHTGRQTRQLHAFNAAFMAALTTFYTLHRLTHRLGADPGSPLPALIAPMHALLAAALKQPLTPQNMDPVRAQLLARIGLAKQSLAGTDRAQRIDFETAIELLERYARDMAAFGAIYLGLTQQKRLETSDPVAYSPKTPPALVVAAGARAATAVLVGGTLWYWLEWPYFNIALVMMVVFCALASSSPKPTAMIRSVLIGFVIGWPLALATEYLLVIRASGYPMLVLATLPVFALASYLNGAPKTAGIGVGLSLYLAQVVAPLNQMRYDATAFMNTCFGLVIGVAVAYVIFTVVLPRHTMGQKDHVARALWREALDTCDASLHRLKYRFDNRVRDLLSQLNAAAGPAPGADTRVVVRQGLTLLELGHSVIDLRAQIAAAQPGPLRDALALCVTRLAAYFRTRSRADGAAVIAAILDAGIPVRIALRAAQEAPASAAEPTSASEGARRWRATLTDLHSIYTSLQDELQQPSGEPHRAA
ncbi:FUSC family protein [Rugamonas sp.]|uniref:FUSC family protein n=1 Tax=Rugamonas sp. TaxID=1926287 RepID=UPI0025FA251E|nr:FUSC family protein [Rugamonas sp.]